MRILPITISADLIPPTMEGRKQRTRRPINPRSPEAINLLIYMAAGCEVEESTQELIRCHAPWQVGDILYVREEHYAFGHWQPDGYTTGKKARPKFKFKGRPSPSHVFDIKELGGREVQKNSYRSPGWYKRLARFMPKKYARTFLEVTDVRPEHLHDITDAEAVLEGIGGGPVDGWKDYSAPYYCIKQTPLESFQTLWEKINGPGSWKENNWVWVVSFKLVERPANFLK